MEKDTTTSVDKSMPAHLRDKRNEIIWHLSAQQGYSDADIARMFNFRHASTVMRIIAQKPKEYRPKWIKVA